MRAIGLIIGILAILVGGLWVGQGTGLVHWPASSFMINEMRWAYYGAVLAFVGILIVYFSRRRA